MSDLISRKRVLEAIKKLHVYGFATLDEDKVIKTISNLPAVTTKEKIGKWIEDANKIDAQFGRHTYICSECGKYAEYFVSGTEVWWDRIKPNFCPNCGAKMEVSK